MLSPAVRNRRSFHRGKTVVGSLLAAMLFVSITPAAEATTISIVPSSTSVFKGDPFSVDLVIDEATNLFAFQFSILFKPEILAAIGSSPGDFFNPDTALPFIEADNSFPGEVFYYDSLLGGTEGTSGVGKKLLTVSFTAREVGTSPIEWLFNVDRLDGFFDPAFLDLPLTIKNAEVTVLAAPTQVTEPGTLLLLVSGLAVSAVGRRRSRRGSVTRS